MKKLLRLLIPLLVLVSLITSPALAARLLEVDDAYSVALLHLNGADGSTTITDESGKTWTAAGDAQIDTAQSVFGGASGLFDGTGDYVSSVDSADWNFADGDFSIDFRVRFNALPTQGAGVNYVMPLWAQVADGSNGQFFIIWSQNAAQWALRYYAETGGTAASHNVTWNGVATNTWYHVAVTKSGTTSRIFVDGVALSSSATLGTLPDVSAPAVFGTSAAMYTSTIQPFNGWIDELRISKGVARWTENFTPPTAEYAPAPTPTPTDTPTNTPTETPTPTYTSTPTNTPTGTQTPTPTDTGTPTETPTPGEIGPPVFSGEISYGDFARFNGLACVGSIGLLWLIVWTTNSWMKSRRQQS